MVQCFDTVPGPTIGPDVDPEGSTASEFDGGEPVSPTASIPSVGGASNTPPHTPSPSPGTPGPMIQWATPPTNASEDSDGAPLRFRTIPNLLETTEEMQGFEYSGLCLVAAEEPRMVDEALSENCWRQAMQSEM